MTDRAVGVRDVSSGVQVVADYRTRERTYNSVAAGEQVLVRGRERVASSLTAYSQLMAVTAAANSASTWRWMLRNPTGSGKTVALRDLTVITQMRSNALAVPSGPRFTLERWTSTGTPSGGTTVTPARILSGQAPSAVLYSAPPTGLTSVTVAVAFAFFPSVLLTTTTSEASQPGMQNYHTRDQGIELAPGEALAFRQADAGTSTEATHRYLLTNLLIEEFTKP
jgi:hypothetical protein